MTLVWHLPAPHFSTLHFTPLEVYKDIYYTTPNHTIHVSYSTTVQDRLGPFENVWELGLFRTAHYHWIPFATVHGTVLDCSGLFWTVQDYLGLFQSIGDHMGSFRTIGTLPFETDNILLYRNINFFYEFGYYTTPDHTIHVSYSTTPHQTTLW